MHNSNNNYYVQDWRVRYEQMHQHHDSISTALTDTKVSTILVTRSFNFLHTSGAS